MTIDNKPPRFEPDDNVAWLGTGPIPAAPYYDPAYFDLELKAIFHRTWLQIGHVCELPNRGSFLVRRLEVAKTSLLIVRGNDGQIRAFHNICTHRGTELVLTEGGKASVFTCPYHAWSYGTDGKLRSAPDFDRFDLKKGDCGLPEISLGVRGGLIFINLDRSPGQSLDDFLGPFLEGLEHSPIARATMFSEYVYEVEANWKLTFDNFQENYHLRFLHPKTGRVAVGLDNPFGYPEKYHFHGPHRAQTVWSNPDFAPAPTAHLALVKSLEFVIPDGIPRGQRDTKYMALFPSLIVFGTPIQPFSHNIMPITATRSRGTVRIYWEGGDQSGSQRFAREHALATLRDVHSEDWAVIQAGQRGLQSGALQHIQFQSQEAMCRHLFLSVQEYVEAYQAEAAVRECDS